MEEAYEFVDEIVTCDGKAYICTCEYGYFVEVTYTMDNDVDTMEDKELRHAYSYARTCIGY